MEAASVPQTQAATRTRTKAKGPKAEGTPWWLWLAVLGILLFCLFPFYWIINTSLKTGAELSGGRLFPAHPSLANYSSIFRNADFTKALETSLIDAGLATAISLTIGAI